MPYVILNDREAPPQYYLGDGFDALDTSHEPESATAYPTWDQASAQLRDETGSRRALHEAGWRVVPVA